MGINTCLPGERTVEPEVGHSPDGATSRPTATFGPDAAAETGRGRRPGAHAVALQPRQGALPRRGLHEGARDRLLHADRALRAAAPARPRADPQALPQRRRRAVLLREERAEPPPRLGAHRDDPDPHGRAHDRLRARRGPADAGVAGQPGRPRAAHLAREGRGPPSADDPGLRPRSRRAGDRRRVRAGRAAAARGVRAPRARGLPQDLGLEGDAGLRAAQRPDELRADQAVLAGDRAAARAPPSGARGVRDAQGPPRRQGVRGLEPERRAQDDGRRLLAARAGSARPSRRRCSGRRSRPSPTRATRTSSSSPRPTCSSGWPSTATCSRPSRRSSRSCRAL